MREKPGQAQVERRLWVCRKWYSSDVDVGGFRCRCEMQSAFSISKIRSSKREEREVGCSCFRVVETFLVAAGGLWICGYASMQAAQKVTKVCYVAYVAMWLWLTGIGWTTWTYASLQTKETRQLIGNSGSSSLVA